MESQETPAFGKKALFIGGTGVISTAVCRRALACGLNRGRSSARLPEGVRCITAAIHDEAAVAAALTHEYFDVAPEFRCKISMAQGLRDSVRWLLDHPGEQTPDPDFDAWCDRVLAAREAAVEIFRSSR